MQIMRIYLFSLLLSLISISALGQETKPKDFWKISPEGSIVWQYDGRAHRDHLEMSGKRVSVVLRYGINKDGNFVYNKGMVWPMLRTIPNNTHASLQRKLGSNALEAITVNHRSLDLSSEKVKSISWNGIMTVESRVGSYGIKRFLFPSTENPAFIEIVRFYNWDTRPIRVGIDSVNSQMITSPSSGVDGSYCIEERVNREGFYTLQPHDSIEYAAIVSARRVSEQPLTVEPVREMEKRSALLADWAENLILETPDNVINKMFDFSKIRALESIYQTKNGPMHGPGGESYYAAIWANDQAEYANPYFPFTGYPYAMESALNSYLIFAKWMNAEWKPIPSSIIAEGTDIWNGAGDRGDAAMIAYGAARYALASGSLVEARKLWPLICWCLEYCHRQLNADGVVQSDTDELENRFPAGSANLCTSSLYYDALVSAVYLAKELKEDTKFTKELESRKHNLYQAIDRYFHATIHGFDTYRYYEGNTLLRSWICVPLTMGIFKRASGTLDALFSPYLWTENGLLTQEGDSTFWDRSTLYALRGAFMANETKRALSFLKAYSRTRLLGAHVPYAIEAWPEGSQRHLSAESALFGRIVTEGLFGIRPVGLNTIAVSPRLPAEWNEMTLRNIRACGGLFDLKIIRKSTSKVYVQLWEEGRMKSQKRLADNLHFTISKHTNHK